MSSLSSFSLPSVELPSSADYVLIGAGIHSLSLAWRLSELLRERGQSDKKILIIDKQEIGSGASGIACGVVRNNYFQPAMRELMVHSVGIWENDAENLNYHSVGYMQISPERMHADVAQIYKEQKSIGYESVFIEGKKDCASYMRNIVDDWQMEDTTSVLHEKRGGFAHNKASLEGLARRAQAGGVEIVSGCKVTGFRRDNGSAAVKSVITDAGEVECEQVVVAAGPWVRDFWQMLELPREISVRRSEDLQPVDVSMWCYWQLEEGVLEVEPNYLSNNAGGTPPVFHVDSEQPLFDKTNGEQIQLSGMWGIYYKPDHNFGGVQGGAAPYLLDMLAEEVAVDPYGPDSPQFVARKEFPNIWCAALGTCQKRFEGKRNLYRDEPSGGIGCFTPDSFPVFDRFCDNVYIIADSNHGYKMIGIGHLVAEELLGKPSALLQPFRFSRFAKGELHPQSNSPFPWS